MARRRAAAVVEEDAIEELEELEELGEDDDLDELEEPVEAKPARRGAKKAAAPAKKAAAVKPASESSEYDSNWLASYVTEETGVEYDSRAIRMLLRKLAKDGTLEREIGTDRSRYVFPKGPNDPTVKQVIRLVKSGEGAAIKREGLEKVKTTAAKKAAPAKAAAKTAPVTKKAAAPAKRTRRSAE